MKAIIIDDEIHCIKALKYELEQHCPEVVLIGEFQDGLQALEQLDNLEPDIVFLDVAMPKIDGFEWLSRTEPGHFVVIFTTAYNHYALQAIKASAADYLLKPVDPFELKSAVDKVSKTFSDHHFLLQNISRRLEQLKEDDEALLPLPSLDGIEFVEMRNILYCKADGSYTHIYFQDRNPIMISKSLKDIEQQLKHRRFFRVHHSYIVNLQKIARFVKQDGGYIVMSNGDHVKISRQKKDSFLKRI
jgi:two-component system, LytTR family, response regulator